jgi:hypothetical protein
METPWTPDGIIQAREYEGNMDLAGGRYQVYWKNDQEMLYLALRGEVPGWVAIGFEPTSAMKDADILMGRVENGETVVDDMYSTGSFGPHPPDENLGGAFDILEWGGSEENDVTIVEFSRKMDTGDAYDAAFVPGQTITIIYALANTDIPSIQHNVVRGTASLTLT